jgi:hypothetical protein
MGNFGHCNELKRLTRAEYDRELAERAAKMDAIIATVGLIGLAVIVLMQAAERWLA